MRSVSVVPLIFAVACERGGAPAPTATPTATLAPPSEPMRSITLEERANGTRVALAIGGALEVNLAAQLGTGHSWVARTVPRGLRHQQGEQSQDAGIASTVGGADVQSFKFEGVSRETGELVLELRRPWEKDAPPERTFRVTVAIE